MAKSREIYRRVDIPERFRFFEDRGLQGSDPRGLNTGSGHSVTAVYDVIDRESGELIGQAVKFVKLFLSFGSLANGSGFQRDTYWVGVEPTGDITRVQKQRSFVGQVLRSKARKRRKGWEQFRQATAID